MELRHLESFLAIADELHFGRAAARCHVAQPSLSQHLQRLERDVGARLVHRTSHEVRLTPAGAVFRDEAVEILRRTAAAAERARAAAQGRSGTVAVGFNFPAGRFVLPPTLARLAADHPAVQARLCERRSGPQLAAIAAGSQDVGFVYGRPGTAGMGSRELLTLPVVVLVAAHHPWAGRGSVAVAELGDEPCVLFPRDRSPALHDAITGAAAAAGVRLRVAEEVDDPAGTGVVVASRPVVGFASRARGAWAGAQGLVSVPLAGPEPRVGLHVVWRSCDDEEGGAGPVRAFLGSLAAAGPFTTDPGGTGA